MAKEYIKIEIEGEEKIRLAFDRQQVRMGAKLRDIVDDLAEFAEHSLEGFVPQYNQYTLRHIDRDGPMWMPGGAGGGGEYKAIVGVKEGTSRHPIYTEFGTGIYAGRGLIWATAGPGKLTGRYGPVMTFQKHGEPRKFRYWVRGQRGQRYFYLTWQVVHAYAQARMAREKLI